MPIQPQLQFSENRLEAEGKHPVFKGIVTITEEKIS